MKKIVHIGANKTASTLLQRRLFACHPSIAYLGEDCRDYGALQPLLDTLIQKDDSYYDEGLTRKLFEKAAGESGKTVMVFSSEDILTSRHPSVCAVRLGRLMSSATVVLVLRNQLTTWPSWYINHGAYLKGVPRRYWRRHVSFEEWLEYCFAFPDQTPVEAMNYHRHARIFGRVFGADRVRVLLYEDLIKRPDHFFAQWADILELPASEVSAHLLGKRERSSLSRRQFHFDRWMSNFPFPIAPLKSILASWLDQGPRAEIGIPPYWVKRISDYYAAGNSELEKTTGLCLSNHNYPVKLKSCS